jgi:predicted glycosyltransferase
MAPPPIVQNWQPHLTLHTRPQRIVLYSHDTQGLGHMRRNLLLAQALLRLEPRPNILLIGGARELGALSIPEGIDCLTLPALRKQSDGQYQPRSLSISRRRITELRAGAITAAVASFDPDLLIVDKVPLGAFGELEPTLRWLQANGSARCVLGLREILDDPTVACAEWARDGNDGAIRSYYDQIWVYGDPAIYDSAREYAFAPDIADKIVYTGYLDRSTFTSATADEDVLRQLDIPHQARVALCYVGGGQDGAELAHTFAQAPMPADMIGVIITGPFMGAAEQQQLRHLVAQRPHLRQCAFLDEPAPLLRRADAVVAMAGYNTVCEILSFARRAMLVPRVHPRREQLIRAQQLSACGLVDMLHSHDLSAPALGDWLANLEPLTVDPRHVIDLGALERLPQLAHDLAAIH